MSALRKSSQTRLTRHVDSKTKTPVKRVHLRTFSPRGGRRSGAATFGTNNTNSQAQAQTQAQQTNAGNAGQHAGAGAANERYNHAEYSATVTDKLRAAQQRLRERGVMGSNDEVIAEERQRSRAGAQRAARRQQQAQAEQVKPHVKRHAIAAVVIVALTLLFELIGCNGFSLFFNTERYSEQVINLPVAEGVGRKGVVINGGNTQLSLTDINKEVKSIYIKLDMGGRALVHGSVSLSDSSRGYALSNAANFTVLGTAESGSDYCEAYIKLLPRGEVRSLNISFAPADVQQGVLLSEVVLNKKPPLKTSVVRVILVASVLTLLYVLAATHMRQRKIRIDSTPYKFINRGILLVQLFLAIVFFVAMSPYYATNTVYKPAGDGFIPYNTPQRTMLAPLPQNAQELINSDAYTQMLHALLNKSLHLGVSADPLLAQLPNPYDPTARAQAQSQLQAQAQSVRQQAIAQAKKQGADDATAIQAGNQAAAAAPQLHFLWDRVYFESKYYSYFALAPLFTIYLPVYAVTGMVPSAALAAFIASLYALFALYFVSNRILRVLTVRCNPLCFGLSKLAMFSCSQIFLLQLAFTFYGLPYLTAIAFLCLSWGCMLSLARFLPGRFPGDDNREANAAAAMEATKRASNAMRTLSNNKLTQGMRSFGFALEQNVYLQPWWWRVELVICAIATVLLAASRPEWLLYVAALLIPLYLFFMCSLCEIKDKVINSICLLLPLIAGLAVLGYYNFARFGDVFEFGRTYLLTFADQSNVGVALSVEQWRSALFHYFAPNVSLGTAFPFITVDGADPNLGNFIYSSVHTGIFVYPMLFLSPLIITMLRRVHKVSQQQKAALAAAEAAAQSGSDAVVAPAYSPAQLALFKSITWGFTACLVMLPFMAIFSGSTMGFDQRYVTDIVVVAAIVTFIALQLINFGDYKQEKSDAAVHRGMSYVAVILLCTLTVFKGFFLAISSSAAFAVVNPEFYLYLKAIFDQINFA